MQFLAITTRDTQNFTEAQFDEVLPSEAAHARALYADGIFRTMNSRGDVPGAVIILEAVDIDEAERIMGTLPLAERDMMDVQIIALKPYRGFIGG